jgi:hypothetical protein
MSDRDVESTGLRRIPATQFIRKQGYPIADHALSNMAVQGKGPKYTYGKGGVRYTEEELLAFVEAEKAKKRPRY